MKFKNVIQRGDFVRLRTFNEILDDFNGVELDYCPIIGGRSIMLNENKDDILIVEPNLKFELGKIVRIKDVGINSEHRIYFRAENNGIKYPYDDGDELIFDDRSVLSVMINGKWYKADDEILFD